MLGTMNKILNGVTESDMKVDYKDTIEFIQWNIVIENDKDEMSQNEKKK